MPDPARVQRCHYCSHIFEKRERRHYVYPLPSPERTMSWDGRLACGGCFPEVLERQLAQGLILGIGSG